MIYLFMYAIKISVTIICKKERKEEIPLNQHRTLVVVLASISSKMPKNSFLVQFWQNKDMRASFIGSPSST